MAYIVNNENAMFYECGFSCDNGYFLKLKNKSYFITDARYVSEAKEYVKKTKVIEGDRRDLLLSVREILQKKKVKKLSFDPNSWSVSEFNRLSKDLHVRLEQKANFSQQKRIIKSDDELKILAKASKKGAKAFDKFAAFVREYGIGLSEEELFFEAEKIFKNKGKLGLSFSPIVGINENAAKPHALPSKKKLKQGDLLLLDAGVLYKRYCSDRTRTAEVGEDFNFKKQQKFKDKFRQKVYDTVLKAQEESIKAVKLGVKASDIDKAGRDVIEKAGFGKYFIHSTGHGVGVDIHELPTIGRRSESIIEENMVFSIEPGIYLPGKFGVRIEDVVVAKANGAEIL
ncbi:MAG: aminopeptidase P family protein [Campylobacteraceae bacterium]|nr:aminopeptidase P family protein [Campylobacteraceae bacterium]